MKTTFRVAPIILFMVLFNCFSVISVAQEVRNVIAGTVIDNESGETIIGANVIIKGTTEGTITDIDGRFMFATSQSYPLVIVVSSMGYINQEVEVVENNQKIKVKLSTNDVMLEAVEVVDTRITEKQKESPLTVESMDVTAIKEAPSGDFYESLGAMKGVDMTSASIGFKVINTRGFNSTSPVRSLQVIDGVDNQSPGLNFSLGNFLGSSELDVKRVNIVAGASSAYYGPGAFNGVVAFETKDPYYFPGLSVQLKAGERDLTEVAIRWAQVLKGKDGKPGRFGYKMNLYYFRAYDWEANNFAPTEDSKDGQSNPGGYDAVNIYGDEDVYFNNDYTGPQERRNFPGLRRFYRTGYTEKSITDYNTNNTKANVGLYYKLREDLQLKYAFNYGGGSTIYQGDNRFRLEGITFLQNKLELEKKDKWFVRAYATHENAGNSYDMYTAGLRLQDAASEGESWNTSYARNWQRNYAPRINWMDGYPKPTFPLDLWVPEQEAFLNQPHVYDSLVRWHAENRAITDSTYAAGESARFVPGTPAFDSAFASIKGARNVDGGAKFIDRSALYHLQGQYKFENKWGDIVVGGDGRYYAPYSEGTIFRDTLSYTIVEDSLGNETRIDSSTNLISNYQFGFFGGVDLAFLKDDALKVNATVRMDKNQNFNVLVSPAVSFVYTNPKKHTFRATFSSAIRNPTLSDQYLYLNVGRAILLGNITGYDSLVTVESFDDYRTELNRDTLQYFNVAPVEPERVKTIEVGYRGAFGKKVYVDMEAYHSWYDKFIGYNIGLDVDFPNNSNLPSNIQAYRMASNAKSQVTTVGFSVGVNYYVFKNYTITGNYSYNELQKKGTDDPLIPAYNTPRNKYNIGFSGRDLQVPFTTKTGLGFGLNYKWIEGFVFEGSPQFTGSIPSYALLDGQVNYNVKKINTTFKIGASNILDNQVYQVYGGPRVGRMAYVSITYDWKPKNK